MAEDLDLKKARARPAPQTGSAPPSRPPGAGFAPDARLGIPLHFAPAPHKCYLNAQRAALALGYEYVEGLGRRPFQAPTPHAWIRSPDGLDIEITPDWQVPGCQYEARARVQPAQLLALVRRRGLGQALLQNGGWSPW